MDVDDPDGEIYLAVVDGVLQWISGSPEPEKYSESLDSLSEIKINRVN